MPSFVLRASLSIAGCSGVLVAVADQARTAAAVCVPGTGFTGAATRVALHVATPDSALLCPDGYFAADGRPGAVAAILTGAAIGMVLATILAAWVTPLVLGLTGQLTRWYDALVAREQVRVPVIGRRAAQLVAYRVPFGVGRTVEVAAGRGPPVSFA